jgi:hypothetical protein
MASTVVATFSCGDQEAMQRRAFNFISARATVPDNSFLIPGKVETLAHISIEGGESQAVGNSRYG